MPRRYEKHSTSILPYHALYDDILGTELRVNDLWLSMREGKDTLGQFEGTLRKWKDLHLKESDRSLPEAGGPEGKEAGESILKEQLTKKTPFGRG